MSVNDHRDELPEMSDKEVIEKTIGQSKWGTIQRVIIRQLRAQLAERDNASQPDPAPTVAPEGGLTEDAAEPWDVDPLDTWSGGHSRPDDDRFAEKVAELIDALDRHRQYLGLPLRLMIEEIERLLREREERLS